MATGTMHQALVFSCSLATYTCYPFLFCFSCHLSLGSHLGCPTSLFRLPTFSTLFTKEAPLEYQLVCFHWSLFCHLCALSQTIKNSLMRKDKSSVTNSGISSVDSILSYKQSILLKMIVKSYAL